MNQPDLDVDFHQPLRNWFASQGWMPLAVQEEVWRGMRTGHDGLLQAPTGSGKTYAAMGHAMAAGLKEGGNESPGLKLLWISPLRALSSDLADAAKRMVQGLGLQWEVAVRHGDTSAKEKARQRSTLPEVLITTPESVHLLLAQPGGEDRLSQARWIVVDEWHALLGSKRGVQVELAVTWLRNRASKAGRKIQIWGVSATLANPELALEALVGSSSGLLVKSNVTKDVQIQSVMPPAFERLPWAGHIGLQLVDQVISVISDHNSTLVFTNTRRQSEVWYQALLSARPDWSGSMAMHHGSLSREIRQWVEGCLHDGTLKAVVCTASLDLGVDFSPVDAVVQIGGPKGVARMIQRAGRCGHRPGEMSTIHFVPTHGLELVEAVALREAIRAEEIEPREPLILCWDVLVQWLCTVAAGNGFSADDMQAFLLETYAFRDMSADDWQKSLELIATGGPSLRAYTEHRRVELEAGRWVMRDRGKRRRHLMSMGAIVSASMVAVHLRGKGLLGHVEESFVASLKEGESFVFAGQTVALDSFQGLRATVRRSKAKSARTPAWMGGRMSLSSELSHRLREAWHRLAVNATDQEPELLRLAPMVHIQSERSHIPKAHQLLVETYQDEDGHHLFLYPFEGRKVHEALASLLAYRLSLLAAQSFNWACNDDGLELLSDQPMDWEAMMDSNLLSATHVMDDLTAGFNATELVRRKFRDVATIAGLVFLGFPGSKIKERHLLTSTNLLFEVFQDHDPDSLLLRQARDEMLADQLELGRLMQWLQSMEDREVVHRQLDKPSPLSFPLFVDRLRERLSSESLEERLRRMAWE